MQPKWPELSSVGAVTSRPATAEDMRQGRATFLIDPMEVSTGTPLEIEIPQYAYLHDQDLDSPVAVVAIQAEGDDGKKVIGYRNLVTGELGVAMLGQIELLGTGIPDKSD